METAVITVYGIPFVSLFPPVWIVLALILWRIVRPNSSASRTGLIVSKMLVMGFASYLALTSLSGFNRWLIAHYFIPALFVVLPTLYTFMYGQLSWKTALIILLVYMGYTHWYNTSEWLLEAESEANKGITGPDLSFPIPMGFVQLALINCIV